MNKANISDCFSISDLIRIVCIAVLISHITKIEAQEVSDEVYAQIRFTFMQSADKSYQRNILIKDLYIEKPISKDYALFATGSHDRYFESIAVGVGRQFGNLQVALGVGNARYDRESRLMVNGWVYYENNKNEAILTAEHYSKESNDPWYFTGYYQRRFDTLLMGFYGETLVGIGPMIGVAIFENSKLWVSKPVGYRAKEGQIGALIGLSFNF